MRNALLAATILAAFAAPIAAHASSITVTGTLIRVLENQGEEFNLLYSFGPLPTIDGQVTSVSTTFDGVVGAGVRVEGPANTVTIVPHARFSASPAPDSTFSPENGSATGTPVTIGVHDGTALASATQSVTFTGLFDPSVAAAMSDQAFFENVQVYSTVESYTGTGPILTFDSSSGIGALTITVDYTPANSVPEPVSLSLLGAGLLGLTGWRRVRAA